MQTFKSKKVNLKLIKIVDLISSREKGISIKDLANELTMTRQSIRNYLRHIRLNGFNDMIKTGELKIVGWQKIMFKNGGYTYEPMFGVSRDLPADKPKSKNSIKEKISNHKVDIVAFKNESRNKFCWWI